MQVVEKDAAPETVAAVRESLRRELAERMKEAASAQALAQARAQAEAHAHSQLEALLAQKAAGTMPVYSKVCGDYCFALSVSYREVLRTVCPGP